MIEHREKQTDVLVVGTIAPTEPRQDAAYHLEELCRLVENLRYRVTVTELVRLERPTAPYFLGSGAATRIAEQAHQNKVQAVVFDDELSPSQQRNWEQLTGLAVTDRHEIILDIFAERATTREASLQIERAQLEYSLPRLKRAWTHLSRQRGGMRGTRGEGEKQIEMDRRRILDRISRIDDRLAQVGVHRDTVRKRRTEQGPLVGAVVGYTNAGKSSLLGALTKAEDVTGADRLFATLDPKTRRLELHGEDVLLTDTVGFIRKLPHDLVDAFRSTLEEATHADFLIHVVDGSSMHAAEEMRVTREVLEELGAGTRPTITVLNKLDLLSEDQPPPRPDGNGPQVPVSCTDGRGLEQVRSEIDKLVAAARHRTDLRIPSSRYDLVALVHRTGTVRHREYDGNAVVLQADLPPETFARVREFSNTEGH